jgi:SHS2 domain-containing protein
VGYRYLEGLTRADAAFRAEGADLEELFRAAWQATLELMLPDPSRLQARERRRIALANTDVELLLFDLLGELVYHKDAEGLLLRLESLTVESSPAGCRLQAEAAGEPADPARHELGVDVKGVTLHRFAVERTPAGWAATVILDV